MKKRRVPKSDLPQGSSKKRRRLPVDRDGIISRIANEIREQYITRRREYETAQQGSESKYLPSAHWDGGQNRQGHTRSNIWKRIAALCIEHGVDHYQYVQQVFMNPVHKRAPQPNWLLGERMLNEYKSDSRPVGKAVRAAYIARAFEEERARLEERLFEWDDIISHDKDREYTELEIQRAILGDDNLALTPLFRFCLAIQKRQDDIAEYFYGMAILQYLRYPEAYRRVWGDMIPGWFHKAADSCRRMLIAS
jgi:hypothetical protein